MVPTVTLPKFSGAGAMDNCPAVGVVPVPLRGTPGLLEALLVNDSDPETVPLPVGIKDTLYALLCPAGIVNGKEGPTRANWELLLASEDTVTLAPLALKVMA
jgi:hypothetical protein